jgi:hypothetical protein
MIHESRNIAFMSSRVLGEGPASSFADNTFIGKIG